MIKKGSLRRILVATFAFLIVIISLYVFPKNNSKVPNSTIYKKSLTDAIYLIDKNDYVSRTMINIKSAEKEAKAIELINALINGTDKNKYIPNGFTSYIPSGTIINSIKISGDLITVDFNEKFLSIKELKEEKMIESIVFTLTEISGINYVKILINGNTLDKLPISGKSIPPILDRSIGINKRLRTTSFKDTQDVTTYFINRNNDELYYIPVTIVTDDNNEKIEIIIKELESKDNIDSNLATYIQAGTILQNYQILENEFNMEFNNVILSGLDKIDEEVIYGLALSIRDNYGIDKISIDVDNKQIIAYALKSS